ncbi:MAG: hypothetical protein A2266_08780 [Bacteroidetes bacterium RIFOXYA12_FULL_40_10]|nr:MAG: hypothetical protein A2X20_04015 [Bacteroidetes bacterium GWE2_40_15]OFY90952.1 MAG: hypothetical protein A2266_08780 [Bacteroidetes bacterium RIFOXYA12_FULL_40_10]HBG24541.1 hypothetical protein [Rikenellaceae bacterium]HBZ26225.1 hypothetical protein [Rikenellaceae bacterium]
MNKPIRIGFFLKIVLPALLALLLFVLSLFLFVIPTFERNALIQKQTMLSELTSTTWSILQKYHSDELSGVISLEEAQNKAKAEIETLRYGVDKKDYFWITDMVPFMVMHPYVQELTGKDLHNYSDPDGVKIFIEAVKIAESIGEGFINYKWQMNDDSTQIVPKMSFVKAFKPWNWIIGTGIYLDDVQKEISTLTRKILLILLLITIAVSLIITYVAIQSFRIDKQRRLAELQLIESREKYRSLIESSTEGIVLLLNLKISYTNSFIQNWLDYSESELMEIDLKELFFLNDSPDFTSITNESRFEVKLRRKNGKPAEAILMVMPVSFADKEGLLLTLRDSSDYHSVQNELKEVKSLLKNMSLPQELSRLSLEIASKEVLNSRPVLDFKTPLVSCRADSSIVQAVEIMQQNDCDYILPAIDGCYLGIVTYSDIISRESSSKKYITDIMTSPLITIGEDSSVEQAVSLMERKKISHLAITNFAGDTTGVVEKRTLFGFFSNSPNYILESISQSNTVKELAQIRKKIPLLVKPLSDGMSSAHTINRMVSRFNDAITQKIITSAVKELGEPPVPFAFISLGSEGREELVFNSDQDNALLYADDPAVPKEKTDIYFAALSTKICNNLHDSGLELCSGGYMASNPKWCSPLSIWKGYFEEWIVNAEPGNIMNISVFFDLRYIYGDKDLYLKLEDYIYQVLEGRSAFFYFLAQSVSSFKPPVNIFGAIVSDTSRKSSEMLEIKRALSAVVMFARIYALHNNIREKGTIERVSALHSAGILSKETADEVKYHFNYLMNLRINHQIDQIFRGELPDNNIPPKSLNEMASFILKKVFTQMNHYNEILTATFMSSYKT